VFRKVAVGNERKGKWSWKQTMVVVLSGEVAVQTAVKEMETLETLTVVRSADVVVRTRTTAMPMVETVVVTHEPGFTAVLSLAAVGSKATISCACGR
jgi:hypothetical protein